MRILIALLILSGICACGETTSQFTQFRMDFTHNVTIPSNLGVDLPFDFRTPETETNAESEFAINDTRKDLIEEIKLELADMTITSPSGQTFGFLNDLYLYLNADGLEEVLIAKIEDIPDNIGSSISLEPRDEDFQAYIKKDEFTLRVKAITDKVTNRDVDIRVDTRFFVDAKILGR